MRHTTWKLGARRHHHIQDHEVGPALDHLLQGLIRALGLAHLVAFVLQRQLQRSQDVDLIIDKQNLAHASASLAGIVTGVERRTDHDRRGPHVEAAPVTTGDEAVRVPPSSSAWVAPLQVQVACFSASHASSSL
jgi:hypothetical protein